MDIYASSNDQKDEFTEDKSTSAKFEQKQMIQQVNSANEQDVIDLEVARESALKNAELAYDKLDNNRDGVVDLNEVKKLVGQSESIRGIDGVDQAKVDAFFKTFDADKDAKVSKSEWLNFYSKLFDEVVKTGVYQEQTSRLL